MQRQAPGRRLLRAKGSEHVSDCPVRPSQRRPRCPRVARHRRAAPAGRTAIPAALVLHHQPGRRRHGGGRPHRPPLAFPSRIGHAADRQACTRETLALLPRIEANATASRWRSVGSRRRNRLMAQFVSRHGAMTPCARAIDLRKACCGLRKMEPLSRMHSPAARPGWRACAASRAGARADVPFTEHRRPTAATKINPAGRLELGRCLALHPPRTMCPYNPLHDQFYAQHRLRALAPARWPLGEDPSAPAAGGGKTRMPEGMRTAREARRTRCRVHPARTLKR